MGTRRRLFLFCTICSTWNIVFLLLSSFAVAQSTVYRDPSQPIERRVDDLVGRMTLEEKVGQMMYRAPAIERLDVPAYNWWNEGLHGVARAGVATVFPQAIGLAATWDTALMHDVGDVVAIEARAKHHDAVRRGITNAQYFGLTFWSPNINIFRDPRWGRGQETYGEDPFLTARMGVAFVQGLQGNDPHYLKVLATPKHFAVHSGPEPSRHDFDARPSMRDMEETYFPAFRATVSEAHAGSVMCAYNSLLGKPACASDLLLEDHLRGEWKFDGYVVSDCGAVGDIQHGHKFAATPEEAAADAVKAGTDLDCGDEYKALVAAVKQGLVSEDDINRSVKRLMTARFRLGMFDPPERVPYAQIPMAEVDSPPHRQLALKAARESMVLLKNDGVLPFSKTVKRIAVIGPNADSMEILLGNYNGSPSHAATLLAGMRARFGNANIAYAPGAELATGLGLPVPAEVLRPAPGSAEHGLRGEYYQGRELSGQPVLTRIDPKVDFDWSESAPIPQLGASNFSIRWSGVLVSPVTGDYKLGANADDGYRLFLDDKLLIDGWKHGETKLVPIHLEQGSAHRITMEYFQATWGSSAHLLWVPPNLKEEALAAVRSADAVVMALGISPRLEGEEMRVDVLGFAGGDRTSLDLPAPQQELLEAVAASGKPLVVVLLNGSALAVNWAQQNANAILEAWYPGEEGGTAIAETLVGDNNPAGRLPVTFYKSVSDLPAFTDYALKGRTYRYFQGQPLYRFGDGLSYSKFVYRNARVRQMKDGVTVTVEVENASERDGNEVVQAYLSTRNADQKQLLPPHPALVAFQRVRVRAHARATVDLLIPAAALTGVDAEGARRALVGTLHFDVGGHQPGDGTVGVDFSRR